LVTWVPDPTEPFSDLWATILIIECVYLFYFFKFASLIFTQIILHPTEETSLDSDITINPPMILSNENLEPSLGASSRYYLMKIQHCQGLLIIYGEGARARKKKSGQ
jgi:hypothetical protein